ncbi:hypothetical protein GCM10025868_18470 [Angustibacter aerolatus]|uniref:DUF222 domain-containing protein n=1 Tax=Angustibacter aerolatus TaxID=1162965 RepID=A0ABQ6JIA9_9ACTN|nr:hypothetical protein GCM10025868_18470 [Angustibacter aerolatus]
MLHAARLLATATAEAEAGTGSRDEHEKADLLRALGADPTARTHPPYVRTRLRDLEKQQKRRATRFVRDMVDRSLIDLLSVYRDVLVLHADPGADLVNGEMRPDLERLARALSPEQAAAPHGRRARGPRPHRRQRERAPRARGDGRAGAARRVTPHDRPQGDA